MSVHLAERAAMSQEDMHLLRNLIVLPVVLSAFESDLVLFESNPNLTSYRALAVRTIARIRSDMQRLTDNLRKRGIEVFAEKRNENGINRAFTYQGKRGMYALRWGTFDTEIALLTDYYLGNLAESAD
ncbi:hypothetical protein [Paenibacillus ginsengarvi]|uniref:Uncharacterized protein n=1 Tax=Paenibacillus ginsengarvi TaxID=400777 RepID=A0A3B0AQK5_9BACL|nr:hypothetical protein [Paenibacillus ginsengarvi]RKN62888.1 hypothetical protein D7M11_34730 [Paenibacillus ginsengarvi]